MYQDVSRCIKMYQVKRNMLQIAQQMRWLIKSAWHPQCLKQTNGHRWASNPPAENLSNAPPIAVPSSWGTGLVSGQHQIDWHPTVRAQASRDSRGHNHHGCNPIRTRHILPQCHNRDAWINFLDVFEHFGFATFPQMFYQGHVAFCCLGGFQYQFGTLT